MSTEQWQCECGSTQSVVWLYCAECKRRRPVTPEEPYPDAPAVGDTVQVVHDRKLVTGTVTLQSTLGSVLVDIGEDERWVNEDECIVVARAGTPEEAGATARPDCGACRGSGWHKYSDGHKVVSEPCRCLAREPAEPGEPPRRAHHLGWNGTEWVDHRCGCRYHPDDDNNTHGGGPHVHPCEKHRPTGEPQAGAEDRDVVHEWWCPTCGHRDDVEVTHDDTCAGCGDRLVDNHVLEAITAPLRAQLATVTRGLTVAREQLIDWNQRCGRYAGDANMAEDERDKARAQLARAVALLKRARGTNGQAWPDRCRFQNDVDELLADITASEDPDASK